MSITDTAQYRQGANFERRMATWLTSRGYAVSRVKHGGMVAPTLAVWGREIVLPDLQFMSSRASGWLECKQYQTCGIYEVRGNMRTTGIPVRLFAHYREIQRVTGIPLWIAFGHVEQDEVRIAEIADRRVFAGSGRGAGQRYWPWDDLPRIAALSEVLACETYAPTAVEVPLFAPPPQQLELAL